MTDRRARAHRARLDAVIALVDDSPYAQLDTLLIKAEHRAELDGLTRTRLEELLTEAVGEGSVQVRGSTRVRTYYTKRATERLQELQQEREASGELGTVVVPTPPGITTARQAEAEGFREGRQLVRLHGETVPSVVLTEKARALATQAMEGQAPAPGLPSDSTSVTSSDSGESKPPSVDPEPGDVTLEGAVEAGPDDFEAEVIGEERVQAAIAPDLVIGVDHGAGPDRHVKAVVEVDGDGGLTVVEPPARRTGPKPRNYPKPGGVVEKAIEIMRANPGCVMRDMVEKLERSSAVLSSSLLAHIRLKREPKICRVPGDDAIWRWFVEEDAVKASSQLKVNREAHGATKRKGLATDVVDPASKTGRLVAWVIAHPDHTSREIGDAHGFTSQDVSSLLTYHLRNGRQPRIARDKVYGVSVWRGAVDEAVTVEQSTQATDDVGLETAPECSGVVAPRGVVGVDPSEVASGPSGAPPAGRADADEVCGVCDRAACEGGCDIEWVVLAAPTAEAGPSNPVAPVEGVDGAGPSEAAPTASEARPARCSIDTAAMRDAITTADWCQDDGYAMCDEIDALRDALQGTAIERDFARTEADGLDRANKTLQREIQEARQELSKVTAVGIDTPINVVAKRITGAAAVGQMARDALLAEHNAFAAFIEKARGHVLRLLGSEADVSDTGTGLDELLTTLEARVRNLEAHYNRGPVGQTESHVEVLRLAGFIERTCRGRAREGETPVDTAMRLLMEADHSLVMIAHLARGGEVALG